MPEIYVSLLFFKLWGHFCFTLGLGFNGFRFIVLGEGVEGDDGFWALGFGGSKGVRFLGLRI